MSTTSAGKAGAGVFGLIVVAALAGPAAAQPASNGGGSVTSSWSSTAMPWTVTSSGDPLGALPSVISIPSVAFAYAARSDRVDVFGKNQPAIIRLTLQAQSGSTGVTLVNPDGSVQLSKEAVLMPSGADVEVYFRVRPATQPSVIIVRNYNAEGQAGQVVLRRVEYIREGDLSTEELSDIVKKGVY